MKKYLFIVFSILLVLSTSALCQENVTEDSYRAKHKGYIEALVNLRSIENYFTGEPIYLSKDEKLKKDLRYKIERIISYIEKYQSVEPNDVEALFYLGRAYSMAHDLDIPGAWRKSVDCLNEVIKINPTNAVARLVQAKNYMDNQEFKKALSEYRIVDKMHPYGEALRLMAMAKMYLKDAEGAKQDLKEYLKHNPKDDFAKKVLSAIESGQISYTHD